MISQFEQSKKLVKLKIKRKMLKEMEKLDLKRARETEEHEAEEKKPKKKKQLNSSDEEWCPQVKVKPKKPTRRVSSSEDDMAQEAEG